MVTWIIIACAWVFHDVIPQVVLATRRERPPGLWVQINVHLLVQLLVLSFGTNFMVHFSWTVQFRVPILDQMTSPEFWNCVPNKIWNWGWPKPLAAFNPRSICPTVRLDSTNAPMYRKVFISSHVLLIHPALWWNADSVVCLSVISCRWPPQKARVIRRSIFLIA